MRQNKIRERLAQIKVAIQDIESGIDFTSLDGEAEMANLATTSSGIGLQTDTPDIPVGGGEGGGEDGPEGPEGGESNPEGNPEPVIDGPEGGEGGGGEGGGEDGPEGGEEGGGEGGGQDGPEGGEKVDPQGGEEGGGGGDGGEPPCPESYPVGTRVRIRRTGEIGVVTAIRDDCSHEITPISQLGETVTAAEGALLPTESDMGYTDAKTLLEKRSRKKYNTGGQSDNSSGESDIETYSYDDLEPAPESFEEKKYRIISLLNEIFSYQFKYLQYADALKDNSTTSPKGRNSEYSKDYYNFIVDGAIFYAINKHHFDFVRKNRILSYDIDEDEMNALSYNLRAFNKLMWFGDYLTDYRLTRLPIMVHTLWNVYPNSPTENTNIVEITTDNIPDLFRDFVKESIQRSTAQELIERINNSTESAEMLYLFVVIEQYHQWFLRIKKFDKEYYRILGLISISKPELFDADTYMLPHIDLLLQICGMTRVTVSKNVDIHEMITRSKDDFENYYLNQKTARRGSNRADNSSLVIMRDMRPDIILSIIKDNTILKGTALIEKPEIFGDITGGFLYERKSSIQRIDSFGIDPIGDLLSAKRELRSIGNQSRTFPYDEKLSNMYELPFQTYKLFNSTNKANFIQNSDMLYSNIISLMQSFFRELQVETIEYVYL